MTSILDVAADISLATSREALTPRWEATLREFYGLELREQDADLLESCTQLTKAQWMAAGKGVGLNRRARRELWARVGRRGRKSFTAALIAVFEAIYGEHERYLVEGERGLIAAISKDVAGSTLIARFCELHAHALGIATNWTTMGSVRILELDGFQLGIACFPCNARAPRGYAIPVIIGDEIAHWATDADEYTNADTEVLGGVKPAMAQFPDSKLIAISSPFGVDGLHFETVEANLGEGGDPGILAVEGPTWEWNPSISEARTHELEKDPRRHAMEYGAKASKTVSLALDTVDTEACTGLQPRGVGIFNFLAIDASSLRGDAFAWIEGYQTGCLELVVSGADAFEGDALRGLRMSDVVDRIAERAHALRVRVVYGDQREDASLISMFAERNIIFDPIPWTDVSKDDAFQALRRLMRERKLILPHHEKLLRECRTVKARLMPSGRTKYETNGKDYLSALVTLAHRVVSGHIGVEHEPFNATDTTRRVHQEIQRAREASGFGAGSDRSGW